MILILVATCMLFFALAVPVWGSLTLSEKQRSELIEKAVDARAKSYAPYSNFHVGAALMDKQGKIFQGANVENSSYSLGCCAERVALFKAVSEGSKEFLAIAVCVPGGGNPCGACRQVLNEFNPNLQIILVDAAGKLVSEKTLFELLPEAFGPHNLESRP